MSEMSLSLPSSVLLALLLASGLAHGGSLTVTAQQQNGKPLTGAVVTVDAESPALPPAPPAKATMDQVNLAFAPDVLVVSVHSTVQFPNSDVISHQVYSFSSARRFQLPLYRGKPYPPVTFDEPGLVTLGCNIHDNMLAYIVVTRAPFFGRTDTKGEWSAANLPAGRYRLRLWHPLLNEPLDIERTIEAGAGNYKVDIRLSRALRPAPLTGRPHSWDY
jgi:plastocyanin